MAGILHQRRHSYANALLCFGVFGVIGTLHPSLLFVFKYSIYNELDSVVLMTNVFCQT
jgi:hypothetical protein